MKLFNILLLTLLCLYLNIVSIHAEQLGIISVVGNDSSSCSWIQEQKVGPTRPAKHQIVQAVSDMRIAAFDQYYYILEGTGKNKIRQYVYDIDSQNSPTPVWDYTITLPYDMVFVNNEKAYVLSNEASAITIVNLSADTEKDFIKGHIPLNTYNDNNGSPEMTCGITIENKAFIVLQRLESQPYLAVIDSSNDTNLTGFPLSINSPSDIQYIEDNNKIYVLGEGKNSKGGIEQIESSEPYTTTVILNNSNDEYFKEMALIDETDGFVITASSTSNVNTLCHINITTKEISPVQFNTTDSTYLKNKTLSGLALDLHDRLWVVNQTDKKVFIINTTPNQGKYQGDEDIDFSYDYNDKVPQQITFCNSSSTDDNAKQKPSSSGESGNFCFIGLLLGK